MSCVPVFGRSLIEAEKNIVRQMLFRQMTWKWRVRKDSRTSLPRNNSISISIYIEIIHRLRYLILIPLIGYVFQVVGRPFLSLSIISGSFMKTCLPGREELDDSILVSGVSDGVSRLEDSNFSKMLNSSHPKTWVFSSKKQNDFQSFWGRHME